MSISAIIRWLACCSSSVTSSISSFMAVSSSLAAVNSVSARVRSHTSSSRAALLCTSCWDFFAISRLCRRITTANPVRTRNERSAFCPMFLWRGFIASALSCTVIAAQAAPLPGLATGAKLQNITFPSRSTYSAVPDSPASTLSTIRRKPGATSIGSYVCR